MKVKKIVDILGRFPRVFIQTHNFPDHDALATAFGLRLLLKEYDLVCPVVYGGTIIRRDLKEFIDNLGLPANPMESFTFSPQDGMIIVDGCKGNKNVTLTEAVYAGVIDHHQGGDPGELEFVDIRPNYGSCSTIIYEYYREAGVTISKEAATAFMVGLYTDTSFLTRGMSKGDMDMFTGCYNLSDIDFVGRHVRNKIQASDLPYFRYLLKHITIQDLCGFCFIPVDCDQNLMGILADYCLSIQDIRFVMIVAFNGTRLNFSARSEREEWDAAEIVRELISPQGSGGGHSHMAGGFIPDAGEYDQESIRSRLFAILEIEDKDTSA